MKQGAPTKEDLVRFLLGDLPSDEQEDIEISLLDEDVFDKYLEIEIELIEKYLSGQLSSRDAELFRRNYLTTRRGQEQVEAVKAVASYMETLPDPPPLAPDTTNKTELLPLPVSQQSPPIWQNPAPQPRSNWLLGGLGVISAILLSTTLYFALNSRQQARQVREIQANSESVRAKNEREIEKLRENSNALGAELEKRKSEQENLEAKLVDQQRKFQEELQRAQRQTGQNQNRQVPDIPAANLNFDYEALTRGGSESSPFPLKPGIKIVNFRVNFPPDKNLTRVSQVIIEALGGDSIWESSKPLGVRRVGNHYSVTVKNVPANRFSTGDYMLTLSGTDSEGQPKSLKIPFALKKE